MPHVQEARVYVESSAFKQTPRARKHLTKTTVRGEKRLTSSEFQCMYMLEGILISFEYDQVTEQPVLVTSCLSVSWFAPTPHPQKQQGYFVPTCYIVWDTKYSSGKNQTFIAKIFVSDKKLIVILLL